MWRHFDQRIFGSPWAWNREVTNAVNGSINGYRSDVLAEEKSWGAFRLLPCFTNDFIVNDYAQSASPGSLPKGSVEVPVSFPSN
jgi:hypothetical protein